MELSGHPQTRHSIGYSWKSRPSSPSTERREHRYATSTSSIASSFESDATLCSSPHSLYQIKQWGDRAQRRPSILSSSSSSSASSTLAEAAPEQHLRRFANRQCALLRERYPTCHIIALPRGARPLSLQVFGCRDQDGERKEDGDIESFQTILYCGQVEEVVMDFLVLDSGRLEVDAE
jgi:hypothetical protein